MKKIIFKLSELRATFWFLPVIIIIASILLSIGLMYIDDIVSFPKDGLSRFFLVNSLDSARIILSTISGAMIGVAGTVFSVTLVALTLASSQFGPRLIKNFMYVQLNQVVLGSYVSTYLYCLLVLNTLRDNNGYTFIPSISILVAILATIVNIILLIVFIHQIATSIQADNVISDILDVMSKKSEAMFPQKMGLEKEGRIAADRSTAISTFKNKTSIKSPKSGYFQYIDSETFIELITEKEAFVELYCRPGAYLVKGMEIGLLYSNDQWEEGTFETFFNQFVIGKIRTSQQDLEFSINQMVEIASRSLSPGINDPFTAIACIDNLTAMMAKLAQIKFPSRYRYDEQGELRVIVNTLDFEGALNAAFNQIRQFSEGCPAVIIRLMEALNTIYDFAKEYGHKEVVIKHMEMVLRVGVQTIKEENDIQDLKDRAKKILQQENVS